MNCIHKSGEWGGREVNKLLQEFVTDRGKLKYKKRCLILFMVFFKKKKTKTNSKLLAQKFDAQNPTTTQY